MRRTSFFLGTGISIGFCGTPVFFFPRGWVFCLGSESFLSVIYRRIALMSTSALEGADLKIERAKRHLANLKEVTKRAFDPKSYEFRREIDNKTGKNILWAYRFSGITTE